MALLENAFALLDDTDGDDSKLLAPVAAKAEKKPANKNNNNQRKPQPAAAPNVSRARRYENGRGSTSPGSGRYNGNGFNNRQNGAPQSNNGLGNGYRMYNGQADSNKQYGGYVDGYHQNREGNGYHRANRQSDTQEQNGNNGGYREYGRGSASGYEKNGSKPQEWRDHVGDRRKEFNKINRSSNKHQVLGANQQVGSQGQEKLAEDNSFEGDEHQVENAGWNYVGDRRATGRRRNSSRLGGMSRVKGEASVYTSKQSLNGEPGDSDDKNATTEGEEKTGVLNESEPRRRNHEQVTERNESKDLMKEEKKARNMTLEEYEKQMIEKRKALEALKQQERKVIIDKDFELTQLIGRKKEDFATKLNYEKEKVEEEEGHEKDEKVRKVSPQPMSMAVFLKGFKRGDRPREERGGDRRDFERDGRGRGGRGELEQRGRGGYGRDFERDGRHSKEFYPKNGVDNDVKEAAPSTGESNGIVSQAFNVDIQDNEHFPGLSTVAKV